MPRMAVNSEAQYRMHSVTSALSTTYLAALFWRADCLLCGTNCFRAHDWQENGQLE